VPNTSFPILVTDDGPAEPFGRVMGYDDGLLRGIQDVSQATTS
jgi:hypothetical protein